ncbi:Agglutinin-like protein, partial [Meyerozyma sp. JA9]
MIPIILFTLWAAVVSAAQVSGIFTGFSNLVWQNGANYYKALPGFPSWLATLDWSIQGSKYKAGDTFDLNMPCVFKFTTNDQTVELKVNNDAYATCTLYSGEIVTAYSQLQCTISDLVNAQTDVSGTVTVPLAFNVGGSANEVDIEDANCYTAGQNTVTFTDGDHKISIDVNFNSGPTAGGINPDQIIYSSRVIPTLNKLQHYLVAGNCPNGYSSGTLAFTVSNTNLDCSSFHAQVTSQLNSWYYPENSQDFNFQTSCSANTFTVTYSNIPAGLRPFIDILGSTTSASGGTPVTYTNNYYCVGDRTLHRNSRSVTWGSYKNADSGSNGNAVVLTTKTWTGTTTRVTTLPYNTNPGNTKTIEVDVPIPTTTITKTWTGTNTFTTTKTATPGGTATVEVDVPTPATTITKTWTGTDTTTTTHTA